MTFINKLEPKIGHISLKYKVVNLVSVSLVSFTLMMTQTEAAVITFTDKIAWETALADTTFITEDFNGVASDFLENSTGNSVGTVTTLDLIGGIGDAGPTGLTGNGFLQGEVDSVGSDVLSLQFNTPSIIGFAFEGLQNNSNANPKGLDLEEIGIRVDGESFLVSDILGLSNSSDGNQVLNTESIAAIPFLGFITMTSVTSFDLLHGDFVAPGGVAGGNESFFLDGLILAQEESISVPEPSSMLLLSTGLIGFLALQKRKKRKP